MVSEWMANGNIMEYVGRNSGNHLKLSCYTRIFPCRSLNTFQLTDVAEGLGYLHNCTRRLEGCKPLSHDLMDTPHAIVQANILITNKSAVSAYLADFGFMTIVPDPSFAVKSTSAEMGGGTTPFMAPEPLVPSMFGIDKCSRLTKEADIYAMGMVIYQVRTARCPVRTHIGS